MPGMLDLADVFELVVDGLDDCSLPPGNLVHQLYQLVFHLLFAAGNEFSAPLVEFFEEGLRNVSAIAQRPLGESPKSLPKRFRVISGTGPQSSVLARVSLNASSSPWSLIMRWRLKPKCQSTEFLPPPTQSLNTL